MAAAAAKPDTTKATPIIVLATGEAITPTTSTITAPTTVFQLVPRSNCDANTAQVFFKGESAHSMAEARPSKAS